MNLKEKLKYTPLLGNILCLAKDCCVKIREGWDFAQLSRFVKKRLHQILRGLPSTIAFEPVSACTLDCDFCILRDLKTWKYRKKTMMSFDEFKKIIDDIHFFTTNIEFSGGEPLLNKDIFTMLDYARAKGIYTHLATNAQLLTTAGMVDKLLASPPDSIIISYETLEKETYEAIRKRGDFGRLEEGIKVFVEAKRRRGQKLPSITMQMVLTKQNMPYEGRFFDAVKALGADYGSIKALGVWPEGDAAYDREMLEKYIVTRSEHKVSRHDIDAEGNIVFLRKPGQCPAVRHAMIGSGGEVIPCWYIVVRTPVMGNAVEQNFVDIWNSPAYRDYRRKMKNDWANPLCHRCIGVGAGGEIRKLT